MEAKLDLILSKVIGLEQDMAAVKQDIAVLKQDVSGLKQDVSGLKQDVSGLKQDVSGLKQDVARLTLRADRQDERIEELIAASRQNWADFSSLYRRFGEDLKLFQDRMEGKLSQVNQSIVALKDSLERQDYRSDELGRRVTALETRPTVSFDK